MNKIIHNKIVKIIFLLILGIFCISAVSHAAFVYQDDELLNKYHEWLERDNFYGNFHAAKYLWAYIQRAPDAYNQYEEYRNNVDQNRKILEDRNLTLIRNYKKIISHLDHCECFPCGYCKLTEEYERAYYLSDVGVGKVSASIDHFESEYLVPPGKVIVCEKKNFKGQCSVLSEGRYNNHKEFRLKNDNTISSILVGSRVEATLCYGYRLSSTCKTYDRDVSNLYSFDNKTSSIRVSKRRK